MLTTSRIELSHPILRVSQGDEDHFHVPYIKEDTEARGTAAVLSQSPSQSTVDSKF